jgi:Restriction endonuclease
MRDQEQLTGYPSSSYPGEDRFSLMPQEDEEWRQYERHIYERLKEAGGPDAEVKFDQSLPGRFSGIDRQVDALATGHYAGEIEKAVTAAVDCKFYKRKVDVKGVEAFIGLIDDVGTDLGLLITTAGFSDAAVQRARKGSRGLRLKVIPSVIVADIDQIPTAYFSAPDEAYYEGSYFDNEPYGSVGATVRYHHVAESDYPVDPAADLDWQEEVLAVGEGDELSWGDESGRAAVAKVVLSHRLGEEPSEDYVRMFVDGIAGFWRDGQSWELYEGEIHQKVGL